MSMLSQVEAVTAILRTKLEAIEYEGVGLIVYDYDPGVMSAVPAAVISLPEARRVGIDDPEEELGFDDLWLEFPVTFYFLLRDPKESQHNARELAFLTAAAIDEDFTLAGTARDARMTDIGFDLDAQRASDGKPMVVVLTTVAAHLKIPFPD